MLRRVVGREIVADREARFAAFAVDLLDVGAYAQATTLVDVVAYELQYQVELIFERRDGQRVVDALRRVEIIGRSELVV